MDRQSRHRGHPRDQRQRGRREPVIQARGELYPYGRDDAGCHILHADMDAFYASVELADNPELRGKAVVVGGDSQRGVVTSATYEARAYGVRSAMPSARAHQLCPHAIFLPGRHRRYQEVSREIMAIFRSVTPVVEQLSIDEAFLDVSGAIRRLGPPVEIARALRTAVRAAVDVPVSIGIAQIKHVAKIASGRCKPDGMLLIPADATIGFLRTLPVNALWGVGGKTEAALARYGYRSVKDVADAEQSELQRIVGEALGQRLWELANGIDPREVEVGRVEKSISKENTFSYNVCDAAVLRKMILTHSDDVARQLRAGDLRGKTVTIKVRFADFSTVTRSRTLARPTASATEIYQVASDLFTALRMRSGGVRLIGVRVSSLCDSDEGVQLSLLGDDERTLQAERATDQIRQRFGAAGITRGSLLDTPSPPPAPSAE